jgi:hypothetical protein
LSQQLAVTSAVGDKAQQEVASLVSQLAEQQAALEAAESDRQVLASQRDGYMASFQEAYGKLQEWTVSSGALHARLAARSTALQAAMQVGRAAAAALEAAMRCTAGGVRACILRMNHVESCCVVVSATPGCGPVSYG